MDDDFTLNIIGHGDNPNRYGWIVDMYHVLNLSTNLFSVSQLTQTYKIVELWLDHFFAKDMKNDRSIAAEGFLLNQILSLHRLMSRAKFGMND